MRLKKRASKRLTLKQKYKIERKVKEHKKKLKKEARKNPIARKPKKDPGIPNICPYKDDLLRKVEEHRERVETERAARREQRKEKKKELRETAKATGKTVQQLVAEASAKQKAFDVKERATAGIGNGFAIGGGTKDSSRRAYFKEFKKVVTSADVVLEVLDARDPLGCRCPEIEQMILAKDPNKRIVLVLNKIDLVPREVVEQWLKFLRNHYPTIAFKASTQIQRRNLGHGGSSSFADINTSECLGADTLLKLLKNYASNRGLKTAITVGIIGYPNVGKSSVINSLKRAKAVGVGATPGFTKVAQEVHLDKHVKLLDTPGIVFAADNSNPDVVLRNCVKIEQIEDTQGPVEAILKRCKREQLLLIYKIPAYKDTNEFLAFIAQKYGKLSKGGVPNFTAAAKIVLQDWNGGRIPYYTLPPALNEVHVAAEVVQTWGKEFNIQQVDDSRVIRSLKPLSTNSKYMQLESSTAIQGDAGLIAALGKDGNDEDAEDMEDSDEDDSGGDEDEDEDEDEEEVEEMDADEDEDEGESDEENEEEAAPVTKASSQKLKDASDQFNLQLNKKRQQQQKQLRKQKKKQQRSTRKGKEADEDEDEDEYDFRTDFAHDEDLEDAEDSE